MKRGCIALLLAACGSSYTGPAVEPLDAGTVEPSSTPTPSDSGAPPPCDPAAGCVTVPDGWFAVTLTRPFAGNADVDAGAACPPYWTDQRRLRLRPHVDATQCGCACGAPNGNPCLSGNTVPMAVDSAVNATCGSPKNVIADNTCRTITWPNTITHASGPAIQTPTILACSVTTTFALVLDDGAGWACTSPPPGPCPNGPGSCISKPASSDVCFLRAGEVDCPRAGQTRKVVYSDDGVSDQRICPCACHTTATTCTNPHITLFTDTQCTANPKTVAFNGTCNKSPVLQADASRYKYYAAPNTNECVADAVTATATGDLQLTAQTLCCD